MKEDSKYFISGDDTIGNHIYSSGKNSRSIRKTTAKAFVASVAVFSVCFALLCAALIYVDSKKVVPDELFTKVIVGAALLILIEIFLVLGSKKSTAVAVVNIFICVVVIAVSVFGIITVYSIYDGISQMEDEGTFYASVGIYVKNDSKYVPIDSLIDDISTEQELDKNKYDGIRLGVMILNLDRGYGSQAARIIRKTYDDVSIIVYEDFGGMIDALRNGDVDAIMFNEAFLGVYFDEDSDFDQWAVQADRIGIETEHTAIVNKADVVSEPFIIYISGIDCNQDIIYDSNLSDVNLTVLVDPVKKKVLIINTPRDYYLPLWGKSWCMDKLTHAGTWGVDTSMSTLSDLFGIEYNYYARVNVFSLIKIVDALGGITVHSDYEFYAASGTGGYHQFYVGDNEVDGIGALCFVRERHAFANGDRQRGIHQEECIKAIIKKACSPAIISHFTDVLNVVTSSMKTNIGQEEINALVKMQLSDMASWTVEGISVDGWGDTKPCYTAGNTELWVMIPDTSTVQSAKDKITEFLA